MATFFVVVKGQGRGYAFLKSQEAISDPKGKRTVARTWTQKVSDALKFSHRYQAQRVAEKLVRARTMTELEAIDAAKRKPTMPDQVRPGAAIAWMARQAVVAKGGAPSKLSAAKIERINALITAGGKSDAEIADEVGGATRHQVYYLRSKRHVVTK